MNNILKTMCNICKKKIKKKLDNIYKFKTIFKTLKTIFKTLKNKCVKHFKNNMQKVKNSVNNIHTFKTRTSDRSPTLIFIVF